MEGAAAIWRNIAVEAVPPDHRLRLVRPLISQQDHALVQQVFRPERSVRHRLPDNQDARATLPLRLTTLVTFASLLLHDNFLVTAQNEIARKHTFPSHRTRSALSGCMRLRFAVSIQRRRGHGCGT